MQSGAIRCADRTRASTPGDIKDKECELRTVRAALLLSAGVLIGSARRGATLEGPRPKMVSYGTLNRSTDLGCQKERMSQTARD